MQYTQNTSAPTAAPVIDAHLAPLAPTSSRRIGAGVEGRVVAPAPAVSAAAVLSSAAAGAHVAAVGADVPAVGAEVMGPISIAPVGTAFSKVWVPPPRRVSL